MKKFCLILSFVFGVTISSYSFECKKVSTQDVLRTIKDKLGIKGVERIEKIEGGFFEIDIRNRGKKIPVYVDCNLKYLITGQLIDIDKRENITRKRLAELENEAIKEKEIELVSKIGKEKYKKLKTKFPSRVFNFSFVELKNVPQKGVVVFGNKNSNKIVYVITDPECPYCARLHKSIEKVLKTDKNVQFRILFYPLPFHRHAKELASAVICLKDSSEALSTIFNTQKNQSSIKKFASMRCKKGDEILKEHIKFGESIGVRGTPTIILSNGIMTSGALSPRDLEKLISLLD